MKEYICEEIEMIIKRVLALLLVFIMFAMTLTVYAEPSEWAVEFIENAKNDNLVPDVLDNNYQNHIKRYEYVLIALKVLDKNPVNVNMDTPNPFSDINGHPYETEIIKAYNAGIVGGYEDGTFRPDQEIKREEVAALVYNLVHKINDQRVLPTTVTSFSDGDKVSQWAKPYIEFNYTMSIMSGVGKVNNLTTIDPLGKTTREQAITLLYKVANNKVLLGSYPFEPIKEGPVEWDTETLNELASEVGYDVLIKAQELDKRGDVVITDISDISFSMSYADGSRIEVSNIYGKKYLSGVFQSLGQNMTDDYLTLFKTLYSDDEFVKDYPVIVNNFKNNADSNYTKKLTSGADAHSYVESIDGKLVYNILYKK